MKQLSLKSPTEYRSPYLDTLLHPEHIHGARVPKQGGLLTVPLHRHITVSTTCSSLGALGVIFDPFFLHDNSDGNTTLWINNLNTYDGTNGGTTNATAIAINQLVPAGTVQGYRLVSASMHILPQSSLTTGTGRVYGALPAGSGFSASAVGANATISGLSVANVNSSIMSAEACVQQLEAIRVCWLPYDIDSFEVLGINQTFNTDGSTHPAYLLSAIVQGAASGAPFTIEIYQNFEVTTVPNSILIGMEGSTKNVEDPMVLLTKLDKKTAKICSSFRAHTDYVPKSNRGPTKIRLDDYI